MKRFLALSLVFVLTASILAGCAKDGGSSSTVKKEDTKQLKNFNETGFPIVKDKITVKMMAPKSPIHGAWDQMAIFVKYEEMTGVHIEWDTPPRQNYVEKKNLVLASGDFGDAFFAANLSTDDEINFGGTNVFIPLEGLIDKYAPNMKKLTEKYSDIKKSITTLDGHVYALPRVIDVPRDLTDKLWINEQWLKKLGLSMPTTTDELYNVLKAFKEKDPNGNGKADEIPFSTVGEEGGPLLSAFGLMGDNKFNVINGKAVFIPTEKQFKEYLTYMNKLYKDGLLDQEFVTQTSQQKTAKGKDMRIGVFAAAGAFLVVPQEKSEEYVALQPLKSPSNTQLIWPKRSVITRGQFAITNKNKNPEATMRWIDYFYSEEGSKMMYMGLEGQHWKWTDDSKKLWERIVPAGTSAEEYRGGKVTPDCGSNFPGYLNSDFVLKQNSPSDARIDKEVQSKYVPYWRESFPQTYFSVDQQKRLSVLRSDIDKYVDQTRVKFILGSEPFDNWDKYVATIKQMGVDEYIKIYQDSYDAWNKIK